MFGQTTLSTNSVLGTRVSADNSPVLKPAGVSIDWNTIVAVSADTTLADGSIVRNGQKYLRYGQVLTKITVVGTDTATITGVPTGGTFTLSVTTAGPGGSTQTTAGIAYNAAASAVQTALQGLSNVGTGNATVTGSAGGPYTITFASGIGPVTVTANGGGLTGGTSPNVTISATSDNSVGWFGPFDPNAADGRQTLTRGSCYVADETITQYDSGTPMISPENTTTGRMLEGGLVWIDRIIQSGTNAHSLAAGPTLAELLAAFPLLRFAQN